MLKISSFLLVLVLITGRNGYCQDVPSEPDTEVLTEFAPDFDFTEEDEQDGGSEEMQVIDPLQLIKFSMVETLGLSVDETELISAHISGPRPGKPVIGAKGKPMGKSAPNKPMGARRMASAMPEKQARGSVQSQIAMWSKRCTEQNSFCDMSPEECLNLFPGIEAYLQKTPETIKFLTCCRCHVNFQCKFPEVEEEFTGRIF